MIGGKTSDQSKKKLFIIEMNGNSVSWNAELFETKNIEKNSGQLWRNLQSAVERRFVGIKLNENSIIIYDDKSDNNDNKSCQLRLNTIGAYWKRLMNNSDKSTMKFRIKMVSDVVNSKGESDLKVAKLMSIYGNKYNCNGILYFDENEDDLDGNYESIIEYVNAMYDIHKNIKKDELDYSALPYVVRKMERDDYKNISMENEVNNVDIDMDDMVEIEHGDFDECYDSDDSTNGRECALLIQPKHYILFSMKSMSVVWIPQSNGNINWKSEYKRAHRLICNHFDIESTFDVQLRQKTDNNNNNGNGNDNDNGVLIDNENEFGRIWNKLIQNESTSCVEIVVKKIQNTVRTAAATNTVCEPLSDMNHSFYFCICFYFFFFFFLFHVLSCC